MNENTRKEPTALIAVMKGLLVVAMVLATVGLAAVSVAGLANWAAPQPAEASNDPLPAPALPAPVAEAPAVPVLSVDPAEAPAEAPAEEPAAPPAAPQEQPELEDALPPEAENPAEFTLYIVKRGDTLYRIARSHGLPIADLIALNGIVNPNVIYVGQTLRIPADGPAAPVAETPAEGEPTDPAPVAPPTNVGNPTAGVFTPADPTQINEARWIDVDLSEQRVTAYEGQTPVRTTLASTGLPATPTPEGQFRIWIKLRYDDMAGPGYYLADVPFVMYFYHGYGLHGVFWHANFGHPMSHGCVNLPTAEAEWLFNWAEVGTLVNVHG